MEIQTFLLAQIIHREGRRHDVVDVALAIIDCPPGTPFPLRCTLPALLLLRRETSSSEAPFALLYNLVDEDGQGVGLPRNAHSEGTFLSGERFVWAMARLDFEFPGPGSYRLDITADEGLTGDVYHYNMEVRQLPGS